MDENRRRTHLQMACCRVPVILRSSPRGMRHFVHKTVERECVYAAEGEEHLYLKAMALSVARSHGWAAATEVSAEDGSWKADVLATKGNARIAVEIQWSGQTPDETMRRQERYRAAGIRGLWLLRQPGFPINLDLPAVCIGGDLNKAFLALIPDFAWLTARDRSKREKWHQSMPMLDFLNAAFAGQFKFGVPVGIIATASAYERTLHCWRCGAETRAVTLISIQFGDNKCGFQIEDMEHAKGLRTRVLDSLPHELLRGSMKYRYSKTQAATKFSNGCSSCDALLGQHFLIYSGSDEEVCRIEFEIDEECAEALRRDDRFERWSVYLP